jgi:hypothetical protein
VSLLLLLGLASRHGELESAGRSLLSLPRDLMRAARGSGRPAEVALQETDRPAGVS